MNDLRKQESILQKLWLDRSIANGDGDELVKDGLLYRGKIYFENRYWHRDSGNEVAQWNEAATKLLILTKDLNDTEAWDICEETGRRNCVAFDYGKAIPFYKNLRMWSYGLQTLKDGKAADFERASDMNISGPHYEQAPIARINCKKQCGSSSISDKALNENISRYADLLQRQIALYDADILLCCGCKSGKNVLLNFVRNTYLTDLECVEGTGNWIYYSPSTRKIAINSYHPSSRISYQDNYNGMMSAYEYFINNVKKELI